jgi:hypothetical protein
MKTVNMVPKQILIGTYSITVFHLGRSLLSQTLLQFTAAATQKLIQYSSTISISSYDSVANKLLLQLRDTSHDSNAH